MQKIGKGRMKYIYAGLLAVTVGFVPLGASAFAGSLEGSWSGSGYVKPNNSAKERARCRVSYWKKSKTRYGARATCSTASLGGVTQTASLRRVKKNHYTGTFYNAQYGVSGSIYVVVKGRRQSVSLRSNNGRAYMSLRKR